MLWVAVAWICFTGPDQTQICHQEVANPPVTNLTFCQSVAIPELARAIISDPSLKPSLWRHRGTLRLKCFRQDLA